MKILDKLYLGNKQTLFDEIISTAANRGSAVVNYIYSTIIINSKLLRHGKKSAGHNLLDVMMQSDFVLPDGAALRTLWKFAYVRGLVKQKSIDNLNGTDFLPYFLKKILKEFGPEQVSVYALTVYDPRPGKANPQGFLKQGIEEYLQHHFGFNQVCVDEIEYSNPDYDQFDWSKYRDFMAQHPTKIRLFLNFRGSPHQELFTYLNREIINELGLICFNQGATVDYRLGLEKRAPRIIRVLWLESLWRVVLHPQKNGKKFLTAFKMMGECVRVLFNPVGK